MVLSDQVGYGGGAACGRPAPDIERCDLPMPDQRNEVDAAWAAGLFEGEGSFSVQTQKKGRKVQISARLAMTDYDVVRKFHAIVQMGATHERHGRRPNEKPCLVWCIGEAEKVRELIALFLPYLGERRRAKALELLEAGQNIRPHYRKATHCPRGHAYSGSNLLFEPYTYKGEVRYARRCKECRTIQARKRARAQKGILPENYRIKDDEK